VVIRLDFLAQNILFDENNELGLMTILNGNAEIYIYYHFYCFSSDERSILKWYIIAIQMEIIFCRCGSYFLVVLHLLFAAGATPQLRSVWKCPSLFAVYKLDACLVRQVASLFAQDEDLANPICILPFWTHDHSSLGHFHRQLKSLWSVQSSDILRSKITKLQDQDFLVFQDQD